MKIIIDYNYARHWDNYIYIYAVIKLRVYFIFRCHDNSLVVDFPWILLRNPRSFQIISFNYFFFKINLNKNWPGNLVKVLSYKLQHDTKNKKQTENHSRVHLKHNSMLLPLHCLVTYKFEYIIMSKRSWNLYTRKIHIT